MGQMGNPDPDNYQEQIQNRVFTFEGKGTAEIVIAVTDNIRCHREFSMCRFWLFLLK